MSESPVELKAASNKGHEVPQVQQVESRRGTLDLGSQPEYDLLQVTVGRWTRPLEAQLNTDEHHMSMELDIGVAAVLISESTYRKLWPNKPLEASTTRLHKYTGEQLTVLGQLAVAVAFYLNPPCSTG